jgi:hypothetical protein
MGRAIVTAHSLDGLPREIRRLRLSAPETLDKETRIEIDGDARMVVDRLDGADRIPALWREARKAPLRTDEAEDSAADLAALARAIAAFRFEAEDSPLRPLLPDDPLRLRAAPTRVALAAIVANPEADADLVEQLLDAVMRRAAHDACAARDAIKAADDELAEILTNPEDKSVDKTLTSAADMAARRDGQIDLAAMVAGIEKLDMRREILARQRALAAALPARWAQLSEGQGLSLADLQLDIQRLLQAPEAALSRRQADDARVAPTAAREAALSQRTLARERDKLRQKLPNAGKDEARALAAAADAIEGAGLFRMFSGSYKAAWALYTGTLGGDPKAGRLVAAAALRDYARWAEKRDAFASDARLATQIGALFKVIDNDPKLLDDPGKRAGCDHAGAPGGHRRRYQAVAAHQLLLQGP